VAHPHVRDGVELGRLAEEQAALRQVATLVAHGAPPRTLFAAVAEQVARVLHSQVREDLCRLADEQAALRRVATLVAEGATPAEVFAAVAREVGRVLKLPLVAMLRYEPDGTATVVGAIGEHPFQSGTNWPLDGPTVASVVRRTGRPARVEDYSAIPGTIGEASRRAGFRVGVGAPIVVDAEAWGVVCAGAADRRVPVPPDAERRLSEFTALIATAVSNGAARAELLASRARIVEAADEQRRRVVRDMHDGAQSRLVHTVIALERAQAHHDIAPEVRELVEEGLAHARSAINELRELAHGIHPAILTNNGLAAAIEVLADRTPLPVEVEIPDERFPNAVESAAYFVAAEALTNVVKYARASTARIAGARTPAGLRLVVEDDGVGGAQRAPGGGLAGLGDRVAALDGVLAIESPPGGGTRIRAEIPVPAAA
jgi:signal transduction histidine kinase